MNLLTLQKNLSQITTDKVLKASLGSGKVLNLVESKIKEQLADGENADGSIIGTYSPLTEAIYKNPSAYGVSTPIMPKIAGEPYNTLWTGSFHKSIKANYKSATINIKYVSKFMDGRDENKIINLQTQNKEQVERLAESTAVRYVLDSVFK